MKIHELLVEAVIKTPKGPIIRTQSYSQLELNLAKSDWKELRAIVLPNEIWFVDSSDMIHYQMAEYLEGKPIDLTGGAGVFVLDQNGADLSVSKQPKQIHGRLRLSAADYGIANFNKIKEYPIVKRLNRLTIGGGLGDRFRDRSS